MTDHLFLVRSLGQSAIKTSKYSKVIIGFVSTIVAGFIFFLARLYYDMRVQHMHLIESISNISIGCSKEWAENSFGNASFSYEYEILEDALDDNDLMDELQQKKVLGFVYVTDIAIIDMIFDSTSMSCMAFFVTSTNGDSNNEIALQTPYSMYVNQKNLNQFSYYEIYGEPLTIVSFITNGTGRLLYLEKYYYGNGGNYYDFYFGFMDYGNTKSCIEVKDMTGLFPPRVDDDDYSGAAEPPVRRGESHLSGTDGATCNVVA